MIEAKVICDSINDNNHRLTTFVVTLNRYCLAEYNTHRMLSRNSASSRAIPTEKMLKRLRDDPALPVEWGSNKSGMQAGEELTGESLQLCQEQWLNGRDLMMDTAAFLRDQGLHKQVANRVLEPWLYTTIITTATEWENFFSLRAESMAQPEFRQLAYLMLEAYNESKPAYVAAGDWHIPFGDRMIDGLTENQKIKVAVARCARVSYLNFDGEINYEDDYNLHDRLLESSHCSPFEHVAQAPFTGQSELVKSTQGNFRGWIQYRKLLPRENRKDNRVKRWVVLRCNGKPSVERR